MSNDFLSYALGHVSQEMIPLNYKSKHLTVYRELHHILRGGRLLTWTPEFSQLWACLEDRLAVVALVSSGLHREALEKALVSQLMEAVVRPSNQRFYKPDLITAPTTAPIQPATSSASVPTPPAATPPPAPASTASATSSNDGSSDEAAPSSGNDNDEDGESSGDF